MKKATYSALLDLQTYSTPEVLNRNDAKLRLIVCATLLMFPTPRELYSIALETVARARTLGLEEKYSFQDTVEIKAPVLLVFISRYIDVDFEDERNN